MLENMDILHAGVFKKQKQKKLKFILIMEILIR